MGCLQALGIQLTFRQSLLDSSLIHTLPTTLVYNHIHILTRVWNTAEFHRELGRTRFQRLFLIGCSSIYLTVDALKAAVGEAKRGKDVYRYQIAVKALRDVAPEEPDAVSDHEWEEKTTAQVQAETNKLETELKGYKNNLIKESIRVGVCVLSKEKAFQSSCLLTEF